MRKYGRSRVPVFGSTGRTQAGHAAFTECPLWNTVDAVVKQEAKEARLFWAYYLQNEAGNRRKSGLCPQPAQRKDMD